MNEVTQQEKKIRLTYVVPSLNVGGLERQLLQHVDCLRKIGGYKITIVTLRTSPSESNFIEEAKQLAEVISCSNGNRFDLFGVFRVWKTLARLKPDVVISSTFPANTIARIARPLMGFKSIAREHNVYPERTFIHNIINNILSRKLFCDVYLAVSKEAAESARKQAWLPEGSVKVIENGIDVHAWDKRVAAVLETPEAIKQSLHLPKDKKVILNIARFKAKKNQKLLIDGFDLFSKEHDDYVLVLVGGGEEYDSLRTHADSLLSGKQVFLFQRRSDIERFYMIGDIFALTSSQEGFPNVLLEALYFKMPTVSTAAPGVSAVVTDPLIGKIVDGSSNDVAKGLQDVAHMLQHQNQAVTQTLGEHVQKFSIESIVEQYTSLIEMLLQKKT